MNEDIATIPPTDEEIPTHPDSVNAMLYQIEDFVRRHPLAAALATVGIGCAVGLVARELLTPPPPRKKRVVQLLEDIQHRLSEFTEPAYDRATQLAEDGTKAVKREAERVRKWFS